MTWEQVLECFQVVGVGRLEKIEGRYIEVER